MRSAVRICPDPPIVVVRRPVKIDGAIAQLGERLLCTQEVRSSILLGSTTPDPKIAESSEMSVCLKLPSGGGEDETLISGLCIRLFFKNLGM